MRKLAVLLLILGASGALLLLALFVLESFRPQGHLSLRPREKAGLRHKTMDTLAHGGGREETRWSCDYADEILEAADGRATKVRRTWVSYEDGAQGPPKPLPLQDVTTIGPDGVKDAAGADWKKIQVAWPDPFAGLLPVQPVFHSGRWTPPVTASKEVAAFLARAPAASAQAEAKLEPEMDLDGVPCHRVRVVLEASLENGRTLKAWGDLYFDRRDRVLVALDWMGELEFEDERVRVVFTRRRRWGTEAAPPAGTAR